MHLPPRVGDSLKKRQVERHGCTATQSWTHCVKDNAEHGGTSTVTPSPESAPDASSEGIRNAGWKQHGACLIKVCTFRLRLGGGGRTVRCARAVPALCENSAVFHHR